MSETLRERAELRQHAAALTAQQRLSSVVLTSLPIGLFLYTMAVNSAYLDPLFKSAIGRLLLLLTAGLLLIGWVAMRAVGRIEE